MNNEMSPNLVPGILFCFWSNKVVERNDEINVKLFLISEVNLREFIIHDLFMTFICIQKIKKNTV